VDQLTYQSRRTSAPVARPIERIAGGRFVLRLLFWCGLALAVLPWWLGTKPGSLNSTGATLSAAGRLTGLTTGYVLLVQVVMMSRLRVLERWIGARHLTRWHKELGGFLLIAILSHAALITVGYADLAHAPVLTTFGSIFSTYPDMAPAIIATGMLVCIGLMSVRILRTAIPYEAWYFLHLSTYLVLLLTYAHQFSNGTELYQGLGRYVWIAFYVLAIVLVAWGRLAAPLWLNQRHRLRVADVVAEAPDMVSVYITGRRLIDLDAKAGQFFRWRFLARGLWWQAHPFSLSAAPNGRWLRVTVKAVGTHTYQLKHLRPGVPIFVEGPWGDFTAARRVRPRSLLIAAGSGIAPIRAVLEELPAGAVVIYRATTVRELALRDELENLADRRHAQLWFVVGDRRAPGPRRLFTPRGMIELVPDIAQRDVYLCGPEGLVATSLKILRRLQVPRRQIHLDPFEL
jgi:predicted ferric reductase